MSNPLLSILIPCTPDRVDGLQHLLDVINFGQSFKKAKEKNENGGEWVLEIGELLPKNEKELIIYCDDKILTIGEKRERLYQMATGIFSIQIDSDDLLAPNAIELILKAIKSNPEVDCITFQEFVSMDDKEYKSNHSLSYDGWYGDGTHLLHDGFHFHRTPFFKDVIKTQIAKSVPIRHIRWGEDNFWADDLHSHLKTEIHIPEQLYKYIHISSPHNERYGIKG